MPEWLVEKGIGETRAVRIEAREITDSRILLEGAARAGSRQRARLKAAGPQAVAIAEGQEYLLPKGARNVTEGAELVIEVTREAIPGAEPWKRPLAVVTSESPGPPPQMDAEICTLPAPSDRLEEAGWSGILDEARSQLVAFKGGELRLSATAAMTLIDVDGYLPADELAIAGARAAAKAIRRLDIGGSIGIDLPTVQGKSARHAAAQALDAILPQPFERTAVNGFGFLQVVRPRLRASLLELAQDRAAFETRAFLRRIAFEPPGAKRLVVPPVICALLERRADWIDELSGQVGGAVTLRSDPSLPIHGSYATKA